MPSYLYRWPNPPGDLQRLRRALPRTFRGQSAANQAGANVALNTLGFASIAGLPPQEVAQLFSQLLVAATPSASDIQVIIAESLEADGAVLGFDLPNLIDRVNALGDTSMTMAASNTLADNIDFSDTIRAAWALVIQENLEVTDGVVENPLLLGAVVDALIATGSAVSRMDAVAALTMALAVEDLIANGWSASAVDSVDFTEALEHTAALIGPLVDAAVAATGETDFLRLSLLCDDSVDTAAALTSLAVFNQALADSVLFYGTFRLGGADYSGWVLNTESQAPSQYTNMPFDSMAVFGRKALLAGDGGIFEMTGSTDDGAAIPAHIRTGLMDFATGKEKNVPDVYIGFRGDGRIVVKTTTTSLDGTKYEDWYISVVDPRGTELREERLMLGRGVESRYWQFELHNKAGGDLEISELALRPVILSRRR